MKDLCFKEAWKLKELIEKKEIAPLDIVKSLRENIEKNSSKVNGFMER